MLRPVGIMPVFPELGDRSAPASQPGSERGPLAGSRSASRPEDTAGSLKHEPGSATPGAPTVSEPGALQREPGAENGSCRGAEPGAIQPVFETAEKGPRFVLLAPWAISWTVADALRRVALMRFAVYPVPTRSRLHFAAGTGNQGLWA
ncbi:unnamed protein product [Prorocentrum cordatum]|uniref:Uncharacterized protein n=1 Tax=Prorocentrum cordatum TaxID=2364126 RepID=A0ABN9X4G1_9DINO|nr:unnamed protein product [Polarella glacialis]